MDIKFHKSAIVLLLVLTLLIPACSNQTEDSLQIQIKQEEATAFPSPSNSNANSEDSQSIIATQNAIVSPEGTWKYYGTYFMYEDEELFLNPIPDQQLQLSHNDTAIISINDNSFNYDGEECTWLLEDGYVVLNGLASRGTFYVIDNNTIHESIQGDILVYKRLSSEEQIAQSIYGLWKLTAQCEIGDFTKNIDWKKGEEIPSTYLKPVKLEQWDMAFYADGASVIGELNYLWAQEDNAVFIYNTSPDERDRDLVIHNDNTLYMNFIHPNLVNGKVYVFTKSNETPPHDKYIEIADGIQIEWSLQQIVSYMGRIYDTSDGSLYYWLYKDPEIGTLSIGVKPSIMVSMFAVDPYSGVSTGLYIRGAIYERDVDYGTFFSIENYYKNIKKWS